MGDTPSEIARDVLAVGRISAVPTLLQVLCDITGMGFAAVARVTDKTWVACAVQDDLNFGLKPGGELDVNTTLCVEVRASQTPIVIDQASVDPRYCSHHTPKFFNIESYISVPIVLKGGRYFGNLCAIDPKPAKVSEPRIVSMFNRFAQLIALQLDDDFRYEQEHAALLDERAVGELREQFIAILGHDLRNPLAAVYASSQLLENRIADPDLSNIASRIRASARRMSALIDDVLDFARGRLGGGISVRFQEVANIESALAAVVRELQDAQPERTIVSHISVGGKVRCDLGRVQQLVSNLLGNALLHGSALSPVRFTASAANGEMVLEVWNDGEPIPSDSLHKIFAPFWRHSISAHRQGLGLGLHICSQIVVVHKGTLNVTSTKDGGTLFTARLPLAGALTGLAVDVPYHVD